MKTFAKQIALTMLLVTAAFSQAHAERFDKQGKVEAYVIRKDIFVPAEVDAVNIGDGCYIEVVPANVNRVIQADTVLQHEGFHYLGGNRPYPWYISFKNAESIKGLNCAPGEYTYGGADSVTSLHSFVRRLDGFIFMVISTPENPVVPPEVLRR